VHNVQPIFYLLVGMSAALLNAAALRTQPPASAAGTGRRVPAMR
jgi:hypothetical protein